MSTLVRKMSINDFLNDTGLQKDAIQTVEFPQFYWNIDNDKLYNANKDVPGCKIRPIETKDLVVHDLKRIKDVVPPNHIAIFVGNKTDIFYYHSSEETITFRVAYLPNKN